MSCSSPTALLEVDMRPGRPPLLRVEAPGDAPGWAAEHRDALRAVVAEHGSLLIRGLRLRDAAETGAVFRRLGSLMSEKEAFAPRRRYSDGVYSSSKWPPNQPMCMHHELSYTLDFPGRCCSRGPLRPLTPAPRRWPAPRPDVPSRPPSRSSASGEWVGCAS